MIAITSISPTHTNGDVQLKAVKSWQDAGFKVYAFQAPHEVEIMKQQYPDVEFVPTYRTMQNLFKAPYVSINAMLDYSRSMNFPQIMIINSDIIIGENTDRLKHLYSNCDKAMIVLNRMDYKEDMSTGVRYEYGMDAFIIHRDYYHLYPQSIYCMGQTWWDYWIQYIAILKGKKVFRDTTPIIFHKEHPVQYNSAEWNRMTRYFQWENNFDLKQLDSGRITRRVWELLQIEYSKNTNLI